MRTLSAVENVIFNAGERLIPGVTHDETEHVRHRSSYEFFRRVIELDRPLWSLLARPLRIIDLGSGVGHGCALLAAIPNSQIFGVDSSAESLAYAQKFYSGKNITYQQHDLAKFVPKMEEYDYVVSRGVLEHVPDGLNLGLASRWRYRLLFDVPYDEPGGGNPHHLVNDVTERDFASAPDAELIYEDLQGVIYSAACKPPRPNMILCARRCQGIPRIEDLIRFPVPAWVPARGSWFRKLFARLAS